MYQARMLTLNILLLPTPCLHFVSQQRHIKLKLLTNVTASFVHKKSEYVPFALYFHMNAYVYNNSSVPSQPNLRFSTSHGYINDKALTLIASLLFVLQGPMDCSNRMGKRQQRL